MITQIKHVNPKVIAVKVQGTYTEEDEKLRRQWIEAKLAEGHDHINVIVINELEHINILTALELMVYNFKKVLPRIKRLAFITDSPMVTRLTELINFTVFQSEEKGRILKDFTHTQADEAWRFIDEKD